MPNTFELFQRPRPRRPDTPPVMRYAPCPDGHVTASAFDRLRPLGLTYRQLDYWTRVGILECDPDTARGSGYARYWPEGELGVAAAMLRLLDAGVSHNIARAVARKGPGGTTGARPHELAPGLILLATPVLWQVPE